MLERPDVTYLSPADVGAELVDIPARALGVSRDTIQRGLGTGRVSLRPEAQLARGLILGSIQADEPVERLLLVNQSAGRR